VHDVDTFRQLLAAGRQRAAADTPA
jgi:hypothetical protein